MNLSRAYGLPRIRRNRLRQTETWKSVQDACSVPLESCVNLLKASKYTRMGRLAPGSISDVGCGVAFLKAALSGIAERYDKLGAIRMKNMLTVLLPK